MFAGLLLLRVSSWRFLLMIIDSITFYNNTLQDNVKEDSLLSFFIHRDYYITYIGTKVHLRSLDRC